MNPFISQAHRWMKAPDPILIIDTREPNPSPWEASFEVPTVRMKLETGDYSLLGCEKLVAVERKALNDLISCFCWERDRFVRELERFQAMPDRWIIVEGDYRSVLEGEYRSQMNPKSAWESCVALMVRYRIPVLMCGDTVTAGRLCQSLLLRWFRVHVKIIDEVRKASKGLEMAGLTDIRPQTKGG